MPLTLLIIEFKYFDYIFFYREWQVIMSPSQLEFVYVCVCTLIIEWIAIVKVKGQLLTFMCLH